MVNYQGLEGFCKEFANDMVSFNEDFIKLFSIWMKKDVRAAMIGMASLPINLIFNLMKNFPDHTMENLFPEYPHSMCRFLYPFYELKDKWGKISSQDFIKEYQIIYEKQFDPWFPSDDEKDAFKEWYHRTTGKK